MITGHIIERFRERASEWFCAANLAVFGATLLHPSDSFISPAFASFRPIGENAVGAFISVLGFSWLIGLIINGYLQATTSTIRVICAFIGALIYGILSVGFMWSFLVTGILVPGIFTYALISLLSLYSLYWIAVDKRDNG